MKQRVVVILGPTATGKSKIGLMLAQKLHGEIISGDSMLVYRRMDIGTAKPSVAERELVPHHLIDILEPEERYNAFRFQQMAGKLVQEINMRGNLPIIVGGTGLYIQALLENYEFDEPCSTKKTVGEFDAVVFGLKMERGFLYERINQRVDDMLSAGLEQEVKDLLSAGVPSDAQSMRAIGYRQMLWYLQDGMPKDEAVEKLKQATRNFAKRQFTWYRHMEYIKWFEIDRTLDYQNVCKEMCKTLVYKWNLVYN